MAKGKRPRRKGHRRYIIGVFVVSILVGALAGAAAAYLKSAPTLDQVNIDPKMTTYIYDAKGRVLAQLFTENRVPIRLEQLPEVVKLAFLAAEDSNFYNHHGIDFAGIARAFWVNFRSGSISQGGSTITQQLAKIAFLTHDRTWSRKLNELLWSIQIERKYTKDEILESYLNVIYYGHGAHGIEAASQAYFSKSASELNLAEAAMLAGVINGPTYFSPFNSMEGALRRRNLVLSRMYNLGYIDRATYEEARDSPIEVVDGRRRETVAPYFINYVRQQLLDMYGEHTVYGGGLRVYTTLDLDLQRMAEEAIEERVPKQSTDANGLIQPQAALVSIDPRTGYIKAMVGGRGGDQFNRATQATRQPGSAMKPFVYAAAIDSRRKTAADIMVDEPTTFRLPTGEQWTPSNYDRSFSGSMTLRKSLEDSVNVVAAKLIDEIGPQTAVDYSKRLGITTLVESGRQHDITLAFALGGLTTGVTPLEMATAYGVFANGGVRTTPIAILRVEGPDGRVIDDFRPEQRLVLSPEASYIMTDMMRGVIERGTGIGANIGRPAAGKTGTTSSFTDAWFVGYTPSLSTAVWIGNDDNRPMTYPSMNIGSGTASRTWRAYMDRVIQNMPVEDFQRPEGVVGPITIDSANGLLVGENCTGVPASERIEEIFIEGTQPTQISERCSDLFQIPQGLFRRFFP